MMSGRPVESAGRMRGGIWISTRSLSGGGGAERRFARMVRHLASQEDAPAVYLILNRGMMRSLEEAAIDVPRDNVILVEEEAAGNRGGVAGTALRYSRQLRRICREHGLDVVHFLSASYHFLPFLIWKPGRPAVVFSVVAHPYVTRYDGLSWKARLALNAYLSGADAVDALYTGVPGRFPRHAGKIRVTPCAFTDYARYAPAAERGRRIVFSGRLEPAKNPRLLLEAAARLAPELRRDGWSIQMLGAGPEEENLRAFIARERIGDLVALRALADTSSVLAASAIFVSLQDGENYPSQSLLEAMACGNAVIATDVGDTRRLVAPGRGLLLERPGVDALAEALQRLMRRPEEREALGKEACAFVRENHTVDRACTHLIEVWALARSRRERGDA